MRGHRRIVLLAPIGNSTPIYLYDMPTRSMCNKPTVPKDFQVLPYLPGSREYDDIVAEQPDTTGKEAGLTDEGVVFSSAFDSRRLIVPESLICNYGVANKGKGVPVLQAWLAKKRISYRRAVYALLLNSSIVYIGSTDELSRRLEDHFTSRGSSETKLADRIELLWVFLPPLCNLMAPGTINANDGVNWEVALVYAAVFRYGAAFVQGSNRKNENNAEIKNTLEWAYFFRPWLLCFPAFMTDATKAVQQPETATTDQLQQAMVLHVQLNRMNRAAIEKVSEDRRTKVLAALSSNPNGEPTQAEKDAFKAECEEKRLGLAVSVKRDLTLPERVALWPKVGPVNAQRIVDYYSAQSYTALKTAILDSSDLTKVHGIGPVRAADIYNYLRREPDY